MSTHYELRNWHGDSDITVVNEYGTTICREGVIYDRQLAERILASLYADAPSLTYNQYIAYRRGVRAPINGARLAFHDFTGPNPRTVEEWDHAWHEFICADARDERATLQDALV